MLQFTLTSALISLTRLWRRKEGRRNTDVLIWTCLIAMALSKVHYSSTSYLVGALFILLGQHSHFLEIYLDSFYFILLNHQELFFLFFTWCSDLSDLCSELFGGTKLLLTNKFDNLVDHSWISLLIWKGGNYEIVQILRAYCPIFLCISFTSSSAKFWNLASIYIS